MFSALVLSLAATLLAPFPASAQAPEAPLCEVGGSVVELMYLQLLGASRIDQHTLQASLLYLGECPASVMRTFREARQWDPDAEGDPASRLRSAWLAAARSSARDSSIADVRELLFVARSRIDRVGNHALKEFLDGIFEGIPDSVRRDRRSLDGLFERQALAALKDHAKCDGAACSNTSDHVLFLLGTHPIAVLSAMRSDSADATQWLGDLAAQSFSGIHEYRKSREAARRAVLKKLSVTQVLGFQRELRSCEHTLRAIRYEVAE